MKRLIIAIFAFLVIAGCATQGLVEPKRNPKDPSLIRLEYHLGKSAKMMMNKLETKYEMIQKKYGVNGRFYNPDHSFTYFYEEDKLVRLVLAVQQPIPHFRPYTGKLPFKLLRKDTYDSVLKKLGEPSESSKDKSLMKYDDKNLTIRFDNGTISTVNLDSK